MKFRTSPPVTLGTHREPEKVRLGRGRRFPWSRYFEYDSTRLAVGWEEFSKYLGVGGDLWVGGRLREVVTTEVVPNDRRRGGVGHGKNH